MLVKREGNKSTIRKIDPYQGAMIKATKELHNGLIKKGEYKKRLQEIFLSELVEELIRIRDESETSLLKGIILGAILGVLGGFLSNAFFYWLESCSLISGIIFIITFIGFLICLHFIKRELYRLIEHRPKKYNSFISNFKKKLKLIKEMIR